MSDTFDHELDAWESYDQHNEYDSNPYLSKPKRIKPNLPYKKVQYMTDEIDWDATLPGATHALLSSKGGGWYYWKVVNGITHWNDDGEWRRHSNQEDSKRNLMFRETVTKNKINYENNPCPEVNWDDAPDDATHVLFDVNEVDYIFGYTTDRSFYGYARQKYGIKTVYGYTRVCSTSAFNKFLNDGLALERPQTTERTTMNLNNAALLVRDDLNTVSVLFDGSTKPYTYVLHESIEANEGDLVIVKANGSVKVAAVSVVHDTPQIDPNFNMDYGWVIANATPAIDIIAEQKSITDRIAEKLKQQQSRSVREQILAQFGVTNVKEFLALDSDKK